MSRGIETGQGNVGFQCRMIYRLSAEFILPDMIRLLKSSLYITKIYRMKKTDVSGTMLMNLGGIRLHRLLGIKDRRKLLILHLNQIQRLLSNILINGSHRCYLIPDIPDSVHGQRSPILFYTWETWHSPDSRSIFPCDHCLHPRKPLCPAR